MNCWTDLSANIMFLLWSPFFPRSGSLADLTPPSSDPAVLPSALSLASASRIATSVSVSCTGSFFIAIEPSTS